MMILTRFALLYLFYDTLLCLILSSINQPLPQFNCRIQFYILIRIAHEPKHQRLQNVMLHRHANSCLEDIVLTPSLRWQVDR